MRGTGWLTVSEPLGQSGEEKERLVAERVLGVDPGTQYGRDIAAAFVIADHFAEKHWAVNIHKDNYTTGYWYATLVTPPSQVPSIHYESGGAMTAAWALVKVALLTLVEPPEVKSGPIYINGTP